MRKSLSQRRFWKTERKVLVRSASSASARASAAVAASGLSTTTGIPAVRAAVASGTWVLLGDAITTRSRGRCHSSPAEAAMRTSGYSSRTRACRAGSEVTTVSRTSPSVAATSGAWKTEPASP